MKLGLKQTDTLSFFSVFLSMSLALLSITFFVTTAAAATNYAPLGLCYIFIDFVKSAIYYACSPGRWMWHAITWILLHIAAMLHDIYPVLVYLLIVIGCGALIGGCAGFAVEAFSAMLLSATWGIDKPKKESQDDVQQTDSSTQQERADAEEVQTVEEEEDVYYFYLQSPRLSTDRKSSISTTAADADDEWNWHSEENEDPKAYIERTLLRRRRQQQHRRMDSPSS